MKYCENCKKELPDNMVFCSECGSKLNDLDVTHSENDDTMIEDSKNKYCVNCKKNIIGDQKFCPDCGTQLSVSMPNNSGTRFEGAKVKYCANCNKNITGDQLFCPDCGTKLSDFGSNGNNNNINSQNSIFEYWLPVILAGVGAVIGFLLSGLLGMVLGACGLSVIVKQKKEGQLDPLPTTLTVVLFIVDVIFWVMAMNA